MTSLLQDVRYALRQLRQKPGFAVIAVLTLALGIGANTAIYSLLDQAMLRRLPVQHPEQLVLLRYSGSNTGRMSSYGGDNKNYFSYPLYKDVRDRNSVFSGVIATDAVNVGVQWRNQPEVVGGELVSGNYFEVLGVRPALGRLFVSSDDQTQNANPVVVLSFSYWKRAFASDPQIAGQTVLIYGHPFVVLGVAQAGFHSVVAGQTPDVFTPMMMKPQITPDWNDLDNRRSSWLNIIARLKPGVTATQAEAAINPLWYSIRADELKEIKNASASFREKFLDKSHLLLLDASKGFSPLRESMRTPLLILMGMVALVALMACANMASLLLVRAASRVREMSVRYALGAERRRILRQLLVEGLILGLSGGLLGILAAPQISVFLTKRAHGGDSRGHYGRRGRERPPARGECPAAGGGAGAASHARALLRHGEPRAAERPGRGVRVGRDAGPEEGSGHGAARGVRGARLGPAGDRPDQRPARPEPARRGPAQAGHPLGGAGGDRRAGRSAASPPRPRRGRSAWSSTRPPSCRPARPTPAGWSRSSSTCSATPSTTPPTPARSGWASPRRAAWSSTRWTTRGRGSRRARSSGSSTSTSPRPPARAAEPASACRSRGAWRGFSAASSGRCRGPGRGAVRPGAAGRPRIREEGFMKASRAGSDCRR